jgi:hypothetical protein
MQRSLVRDSQPSRGAFFIVAVWRRVMRRVGADAETAWPASVRRLLIAKLDRGRRQVSIRISQMGR